jgi:hypothetical protein
MSLAFYQHLYTESLFVLPEEQEKQSSRVLPAPQGHPQEEKPVPAVEKQPAPPAFMVQGENRKDLVLLVRLPEAAFRALPDLDFLQKLLKAIHHGPDDVAFVNALATSPVSLAELKAAVPVANLISFGCLVLPATAGAPSPPLYTPALADGARLLLAEEIATIVNSQEKKVQLWNALKQMFLS